MLWKYLLELTVGSHQIIKLLYSKGSNCQSRDKWEKIFAKYSADKELIAGICKELKN
jgi:hypothetical protein